MKSCQENKQGSKVSITVSSKVSESHEQAVSLFGQAGTWLGGKNRTAIWAEARHAADCELCLASKQALSPYALSGKHSTCTDLSTNIIEVVHRIKNDSGRLTKRWFDEQIATGLSREEYVEILSLVATSIILDSYSKSMGLSDYIIPTPQGGEPSRILNPDVIDEGAWLPMTKAEQQVEEHGLPDIPNIARAMGLVPSGMMHFFGAMRAHYSLVGDDFGISRSQIELIAARVSSHNECFY
jgi:hypothetical protein